jgi:hypothetical protein
MAVHVAAQLAGKFDDGVWYADLAPITVTEVVPVTVARALGLADHPGRSTMDTLLRFVRDRHMLVALDNCEHLLGGSVEIESAEEHCQPAEQNPFGFGEKSVRPVDGWVGSPPSSPKKTRPPSSGAAKTPISSSR